MSLVHCFGSFVVTVLLSIWVIPELPATGASPAGVPTTIGPDVASGPDAKDQYAKRASSAAIAAQMIHDITLESIVFRFGQAAEIFRKWVPLWTPIHA
jgi:hypothetical protein